MEIFAPNGSEAYRTGEKAPFVIGEKATFTFFEKPRIRDFGTGTDVIGGKGGTLLTERQYLQAFDRAYGIAPTHLSDQQLSAVNDNKVAFSDKFIAPTLQVEKNVSLTLCDEKGKCTERSLGNKHSNISINVGDLQ